MASGIFHALGKGLDLVLNIFKQKNTEKMVENDIAHQKARLNDKLVEKIEQKKADDIRKDLSL